MLRLRPKLGSERTKEWQCCFCFHVRTGTVLLGIWQLMLHLIALGFLAAIVRNPNLLEQLEHDSVPVVGMETRSTPFPQHVAHPRDHSLIYHDVDVGALVTVCTLAITLMLIYGASRGKPAHLLPFFCLQIFDFAITVLTATGYLCYLRSIHRLVEEARRVPWREQLLALPAPALALVVLGAFLVAVLIKAYCISIVWRCYKYLTMRTHALHNLTPFVISSEGVVTPAATPYTAPPPAPDYSSLLPDYEEALKQTPPPSYRAATLMTPDPTNAPTVKLQLKVSSPLHFALNHGPASQEASLERLFQTLASVIYSPNFAPSTMLLRTPISRGDAVKAVNSKSILITPTAQDKSTPPTTNTVVMLPAEGAQARV